MKLDSTNGNLMQTKVSTITLETIWVGSCDYFNNTLYVGAAYDGYTTI